MICRAVNIIQEYYVKEGRVEWFRVSQGAGSKAAWAA